MMSYLSPGMEFLFWSTTIVVAMWFVWWMAQAWTRLQGPCVLARLGFWTALLWAVLAISIQ